MQNIVVSSYSHFERDLKRWIRGKVSIITTLITPTALLVFVGLTLPAGFTDNYFEFVAPGMLVMTVLFSSLQGGIYLSFDKLLGYMNKFLALPSPRESILFGKVLFIVSRSLIQATIIFALELLLGAYVGTGIAGFVLIYAALFAFSCLIGSMAVTIAILTSDYDTYSSINSLISMPMFFASTALMPFSAMPQWLKTIAIVNPVSYIIDAIRALFFGDLQAGLTGTAVIAAMAAIMVLISVIIFRRATIN